MDNLDKATLAGGCFWGVQHYFDQVPGVIKSRLGYTGGHKENPTYEEVCAHATGHAEAVEIEFDSELVAYDTLLRHFFRMHDPTQLNRQGPDVGDNYRSAIFYHSEEQKNVAERLKNELQANFKDPIATQVVPAGPFYEAEKYHQKYTERTGIGTCSVPYRQL